MSQKNDLNWFITHKKRVEVALLALILLVNATANSFVVLMETSSSAMQSWEPWVWEFSSMLALAALLLPLAWWTDRLPLQFRQPGRQLQHHLIGVMVFTAAHILLMVGIRQATYHLFDGHYQFDWSAQNLLYELAKDFRIYLLFVALFELYRFVIRRWRGEASQLSNPPDETSSGSRYLQQVLVKMLNQEFLIRLEDVSFIRTAGNYQELYVNGRAYPLRITQTALLQQLDPQRFVKINRSEIINLRLVSAFRRRQGRDAELQLQNGTTLQVHRNYIDAIPESLRVINPAEV